MTSRRFRHFSHCVRPRVAWGFFKRVASASTEGISKLLNSLPKNHLAGARVAAFDTRIVLETIDSHVLRFLVDKGGYAARAIAKALTKKGGQLAAPGVEQGGH